jgi:uroporphyrin-III C-methyltransferase
LYLVGAGPGDPELLTLKAARVLRECDVVLYDRLVNLEILAQTRAGAEHIYVGKHEGEQESTQREIAQLILNKTGQGKTVVRLKGGDPLVFGRGGEEWAFAARHGVPVELVPGVSSAISVPGLAGIPLTYRGVSQSFTVLTGHCVGGSNVDWKQYADASTLVVLMGVKHRRAIAKSLIEAGRSPKDPVAFVRSGSLRDQHVGVGTLQQVAEGALDAKSPAVWIIGEVVRLRDQLLKTSAS